MEIIKKQLWKLEVKFPMQTNTSAYILITNEENMTAAIEKYRDIEKRNGWAEGDIKKIEYVGEVYV